MPTTQPKPISATDKAMMATASVNNLALGQARQPLGVSGPVLDGIGGNASIAVEVYALGRGVTLVADGSDLLGREGTFKLESNGKVFVFDQLSAVKTNWLVAPIEGDVAAIWQAVEAVDQEQLAKLGCSAGQDGSPCKTAILSLAQGMGKAALGLALAQRLGCHSWVEEWNPSKPLIPGALHLTNMNLLTGGAA